MNNDNLITSTQWVHSCRVRDKTRDFVAVKEKQVTIDKETNEVVSCKNNVRIINEPKRKFWITKPEFRVHTDKKEWESLDKLDEYVTIDRDLAYNLKRALGYFDGQRWTSIKELCCSPYVYGADIGIEALIRMKYLQTAKHTVNVITTGGFDLEKSVLGCERLNAMTVVLGTQVYTAVLRDFMGNNYDADGKQFTPTKEQLMADNQRILAPYLEKEHFELHLEIFDTELEMLEYIFAAINASEIDFISIWNADYDLNEIMDCAKKFGKTFADLNHHPNIDPQYKFAKYSFDHSQTQHIVDKWHWMYTVGPTQYVDGMLLYARIRKGETKEPAYGLDPITTKEIGRGKLEFEDANEHYNMQSRHFARYVAYNIADAILLQLLNNKTKDFVALGELTGVSALQSFGKPMTLLKDLYYAYYMERSAVLGSVGSKVDDLASKYLSAVGGTVLPSYLIKDVGLRGLKGFPNIEIYAYMYTFDIDYSSIYPNTKIAHNISKDSKLSTLVGWNGSRNVVNIEKLYGGLATPIENAVPLGNKFFGLPSYIDMERKVLERFTQQPRR